MIGCATERLGFAGGDLFIDLDQNFIDLDQNRPALKWPHLNVSATGLGQKLWQKRQAD